MLLRGLGGFVWDYALILAQFIRVPIGTATLCTLIDANFCKPDDGQTRPKHVADVTSCRITTVNCVV